MQDHIALDQPLTDKQQRFVFEYLKDQNASAAAGRAGYAARSRASQANVLMRDPAVRERIRIEMQSLLAELRLSALDLMKERMRVAFFRAGKLFDASGRLLGFEEMEQEVRDALVIGGTWRKGEPEIRFRMPNREPALRALERVHERLDKLNEAHYAALEKARRRQAPAQKPGMVPQGMWTALHLEEAAPRPEGGGQIPPPVIEAEASSPLANFPEKTHVFSGSANTSEVKPPSTTTTVVEPQAAPVAAASAAPVVARSNTNPGAPLIKRHDPDLMWGGKRKQVEWEPGLAQQEHMARARHAELDDEVRRNLEARGGRIKPGPLRPQGLPPGYNPPWLRDAPKEVGLGHDRPQFAIGAGECSLDD